MFAIGLGLCHFLPRDFEPLKAFLDLKLAVGASTSSLGNRRRIPIAGMRRLKLSN
jgi:hypothetical protein